jgi:hypothetical protein
MMRKTASRTKSGSPEKQEGRQKSRRREKPSAKVPARHDVRLPAPGSGKRGEDGHIAYLLRQAQAATRLTLERALADLGVTPPQFAVLTMLNAYPGTRRRDPKDAAPGARPGITVDADAPRCGPARPVPPPRHHRGTAPGDGIKRQGGGHDPALVVQNCVGSARG